jgi:inorganic pyrophosphatase
MSDTTCDHNCHNLNKLSAGTFPEYVHTVIEIPMGSNMKVEYNVEGGYFELDRVEPVIFAKPVNYGFIPSTLDEDGDPLDTLVFTDTPLPMGLVLKARVIGVLNFEDDGEMDHKVVCVPADDRNNANRITSVADLGQKWQDQIVYHFDHYKDLKKPGTTKVLGWGSVEDAYKIIQECVDRTSK